MKNEIEFMVMFLISPIIVVAVVSLFVWIGWNIKKQMQGQINDLNGEIRGLKSRL